MPSGSTFPYVNSGSEIDPVTSMRNSCQSEYPNAKLIVGVSKTYGLFDGSKLGDSIVAWGCTQVRSGTDGGAIYAQNHANHASCTALIASSSYTGSTVSGVVMEDCHWTVPNGSYGTSAMIYNVSQSTLMTNCVMRNCSVLGTTASGAGQYVGGFVAIASSLRLVDCHFIVDDTNTVAVGDGIHVAGAFVGRCGSGVTIERCSNNAHVKVSKISGTDNGAGGFVGIAMSSGSPSITDSANFGIVDATVNVPAGGFIGAVGTGEEDFSLTLKNCFNYGNVSSPIVAGGLVGSFRGAKNKLVNDGNSGAITASAGLAGGLVGRILCVGDDKTFGFRNVLQAGAVRTGNGFAGILVGGIEYSTGSGLSMVVSNAVMAGSAAATDDYGQTGLLIGGRDTISENDMAFFVEDSCVLASNASLAYCYDKGNLPASLATEPAVIAPSALIDDTAKRLLDVTAQQNGWTRWISGKKFPELETFGTECPSGMIFMCR